MPGILEQRPDLILIYAGHNEYYGALGVGSMENLGTSRTIVNFVISLEKFKTAIKESSRVLKNGGLLCFNIFTSGYIGSDLVEFKNSPNLYLTKDGMPLVLLSKNEFIAESKLNNLFPISDFVEYTSNISTGKRSVARGVLRKICN